MAIVLAEVSGESRRSMSVNVNVNEFISRIISTQVVSGGMIHELS